MDIFKILLMYMALIVTGSAQQMPSLTPPPATPAPVVTQAPATETPAPEELPVKYTTLRPGDDGANVVKLQEKLIELGFLKSRADGRYGSQTKAAVSAFQKMYGLTVDGVAGNETQTLLFSEGPLSTPTPGPTVIPAVMVPVYYMDQDTDRQLFAMNITCYGSTTIYANSNHVPDEYRLVSDNAVKITLENNEATPSSVTFYYSSLPQETEQPAEN